MLKVEQIQFSPDPFDAGWPDHGNHRTPDAALPSDVKVQCVTRVGDRGRRQAQRVAIARVEELYPFPDAALVEVMEGYPYLLEVIWLQEEPRNMGAWTYMEPRLRDLLGTGPSVGYIGRPERASLAAASPLVHRAEQERIVAEAFGGLHGPYPVVAAAMRPQSCQILHFMNLEEIQKDATIPEPSISTTGAAGCDGADTSRSHPRAAGK